MSARATLTLACVAVAFAAADTYVVVLALPEMMAGAGLNIDELQRAAPIVSGFLLGYVAMLPLIGRVADLSGRVPVLVFSLLVFAFGSLVTAAADDLTTMVVGRFLQGVGGGGLVPSTLALVADTWPVERRGVPLGVVGAVQELGSVLGPLYGALVLALWPWPAIFWINLVVGLALAAAIRTAGRVRTPGPATDRLGVGLLLVAVTAFVLLLLAPQRLVTDVTLGLAWVPLVGTSPWLTPLALITLGAVAAFVVRQLGVSRPLLDLRRVTELAPRTDLPGAALLSVALAGIVLAFATADPEVAVFSPNGRWYLVGTALAAGGFVWRQHRAVHPLVPRGALAARPAWGALLVSFFVGTALIVALVDVPIFARVTVYPDSQLGAALVLLRFLVALPIGALVGGFLVRRFSAALVTAAGMTLSAAAFVAMTRWDQTAIDGWAAGAVLVGCGLGFGLAIAPVNAALLAATDTAVHGISAALVVVTRMVGMLVGISALTTLGLARFYAIQETIPTPQTLCPDDPSRCPAYLDAIREAGLAQLHTVFAGAAGCALIAAALAAVLLRQERSTRAESAAGRGLRYRRTP